MKAAICAVILAVCVARASALDCYSCNDCTFSGALSFLESSTICTSSDLDIFGVFDPRCVKEVAGDGTVNRRCGTATECAFTGALVRCNNPDDRNCAICCDTDNCNSAVTAKLTWFALALASVVAILAPRF